MAIKDSTKLISAIAHGASSSDVEYALRTKWVPCTVDLANNTSATFHALYAHKALTVKSARLVPVDAISVDGTNWVQIDLKKHDGAGGSQTAICTGLSTKNAADTGYDVAAMVAGTARTFSGITDADTLTAGQYLSVVCTKQGTGGALRATVLLEVEMD